jgi:hypothetical protein
MHFPCKPVKPVHNVQTWSKAVLCTLTRVVNRTLIVAFTAFPVCIFNKAAYISQLGEQPPADGIIGHVDLDHVPGFTEEEEVHLGDTIEAGVTVYLQCSNWCVLKILILHQLNNST